MGVCSQNGSHPSCQACFEVYRTNDARFLTKQCLHPFLIEGMVAQCHNVHDRKQGCRGVRCDAKAAIGGVLSVRDDRVKPQFAPQVGNERLHGGTSYGSDNIPDEQETEWLFHVFPFRVSITASECPYCAVGTIGSVT